MNRRETATATLDPNGDRLALDLLGRHLRLSKHECPNTPPVATIVSPAPGGPLVHATVSQPLRLEGTATDAEDSIIPWTRIVWTSDHDGVLGRGPSIEHTLTAYGREVITLTVTDHGGLSSTATTEVDVLNRPPQPEIVRPLATGSYSVGAPILFRGIARDLDVGYLRGDDLDWSTSSLGRIGTGQMFTRTMPAGTHLIALLARDGAQSRTVTTTITVRPAPRGSDDGAPSRPFNSPPTVRITAPTDRGEVLVLVGGYVTLRATATDVEDGTGLFDLMADDAIHWEETVGLLGPADSTRDRGKGQSVELCRPTPGQHDVTARVTDSGGLTASDVIHFTVQRMP